MRTALLRYCLPVTLVFPALSLASLGYSIKHDAAATPAGPQKHELPNQTVTGAGEVNISPWVNNGAVDVSVAVTPDRAFSAEIVETLDKEQVEMRHDEN